MSVEASIAFIANYCWKRSLDNINGLVTGSRARGFSVNDYYYLTIISQLGSPKLGEVADALHLSRPSITALVARLRDDGLVETVRSSSDRRVIRVRPTDKGTRIVHGDDELYRDLAADIMGQLTNQQRHDVDCLLGQVVDRMRQRQTNAQSGERS